MPETTFGRTLLNLSPTEVLDAEKDSNRAAQFDELDQLTGEALAHAFVGKRLIDITPGGRSGRPDTVTISAISDRARTLIDTQYQLAAQQERGAWWLPEEVTLKVGVCNLPHHFAYRPRFAINAGKDESARVDLRAGGDGLAVWAILLPVFSDLLAPVEARATSGKPTPVDDQRATWDRISATLIALDLEVEPHLAQMRYGGGWSALRLGEQADLRRAYVGHLAPQVGPTCGARWRANTTRRLATAFYKKAKAQTPLAKSVLTKPLQRDLAAIFQGDWLAFLRYLGEEPNPAEQITTALPEPRLYVPDASSVANIAGDSGVPESEVDRILAGFGQSAGESPVAARVRVMRSWWEAFDQLHAAQRTGMRSLWGLVGESFSVLDNTNGPTPNLYRDLLDPGLVGDIDRLWDGTTLPRWPERIVSEFHPHQAMAQAFGPAVTFWNGVALTSWFVCEGPTSRTDLAGLAEYHRRQLAALDDIGFPVDRSLFTELIAAERHLGPPQQLWDREMTTEIAPGVSTTISMGGGSRRDGFEILRDVVTRHRRLWAGQHLDAYLHQRWESELTEAAREFSRRVAARAKAPTIKQFASFASTAANHWFGGDLAALYAALGETAPAKPQRIDLLAGDPLAFVRRVFIDLGGVQLSKEAAWEQRELYNQQWSLARLATESLRYLQTSEALGRAPTPKEFGADRLRWDAFADLESGWARFETVIESARKAPVDAEPPLPAVGTVATAGWYPDPHRQASQRYWDGVQWTGHTA